jgi:valyl-tRNA synthetase
MEAPSKPRELPPVYDPAGLETAWYKRWDEAGIFRADADAPGVPFVVTLPPPNVTGVLHMGHVLNHTLQDLLIRWRRMSGVPTLFLPGADHAGIATQNMVERKLAAEGKDRRAMGREAFVAEVWEWKARCESRIVEQMKRLGESCDWSRYRFTLDDGLSRAVTEVFVRLHERGLIYRGKRLINWCPGCRTALSDEEVEHEEISGNLYHVTYAVDGGDALTIATTRPETMLADTGVAVHPADERYRGLVGKTARLPILGRALPIVADEAVDAAFGTGALKVTPGHDPIDFEIGRRHGLPALEMMDEAGRVTEVGGAFAGMDRFAARKAVVKELEALGALVKVEAHRRAVGHCYRCRSIVEPLLSTQWFVRMKPLAEPALAAVREERVVFEPARWTKVYNHWMENIRDWCVSRQLWWGHRIPAWYCVGDCDADGGACRIECREPIVARTAPSACPHCGSRNLRQDDDVLDTWFSSWLWPFSTLGWPESTRDLAVFFPSRVLVTANEILFFWVARMIMASIAFMGEPPFARVLIHGIVRDEKGRKMSKTLGNSPDPIDLMERVGADALRFSIVYTTPPGQDVLYSERSLEMGRHLANKLWNAARLVLARLGDDGAAAAAAQSVPWPPPAERSTREDRWILSRARHTIERVTADLEALRPNEAMSALYEFFWHDTCDWYLEHAKLRREGADGALVTAILLRTLRALLALFHPVMPFVTEEIASALPGDGRMLATGPWPRADEFPADPRAEEEFAHVQRVTSSIRMLRSESGVAPGARVDVHVNPKSPQVMAILNESATTIAMLGRVGQFLTDYSGSTYPGAVAEVSPSGIVFLPVKGLIDVEKERLRLEKEIVRLEEQIAKLNAKLSDGKFLNKAPEEVVTRERDKAREFAEKKQSLEKNRDMLAG